MSHQSKLSAVEHAAAAVREYAGTEVAMANVRLLDALIVLYIDDLFEVSPADLQAAQAKVRQVQELRKLMAGTLKTNGRV